MLIEIKNNPTSPKRSMLLQCDTCGSRFERKYKKVSAESEYHFCCRKCCSSNPQRRKRAGRSISKKSKQANERRKQTVLRKYGVKNVFQSKAIKKKITDRMIENFGVENASQSPEVKEKKRQTTLENYGVEWPGQSEEIREKVRSVVLERYGVENVMHVPEIAERAATNGGGRAPSKYYTTKFGDKITVQGSYEEKFVLFCEDNNLRVTNGPMIKYVYEGKESRYFVDFEVETPNGIKLVEIKSTYWYKKQKDKVHAKNQAAIDYCKLNNKEFCFIINKRNNNKQIIVSDFKKIIDGAKNEKSCC